MIRVLFRGKYSVQTTRIQGFHPWHRGKVADVRKHSRGPRHTPSTSSPPLLKEGINGCPASGFVPEGRRARPAPTAVALLVGGGVTHARLRLRLRRGNFRRRRKLERKTGFEPALSLAWLAPQRGSATEAVSHQPLAFRQTNRSPPHPQC